MRCGTRDRQPDGEGDSGPIPHSTWPKHRSELTKLRPQAPLRAPFYRCRHVVGFARAIACPLVSSRRSATLFSAGARAVQQPCSQRPSRARRAVNSCRRSVSATPVLRQPAPARGHVESCRIALFHHCYQCGIRRPVPVSPRCSHRRYHRRYRRGGGEPSRGCRSVKYRFQVGRPWSSGSPGNATRLEAPAQPRR